MKGIYPSSKLWLLARTFVVILFLVILICKNTLSKQADTLNLQFQWVYPISVTAMKVVDIDHDGVGEILVGFNSDSARVGILDGVNQTMLWQSHGLPGSVLSVAAGDRDGDGFSDIMEGGSMPGDSGKVGYFQIFDGPGFDSVLTLSNMDSAVTTVGIYTLDSTKKSLVFAGTSWYYEHLFYVPPLEMNNYFWVGHLISYEGSDLFPTDTINSGSVRQLEAYDLNRDEKKEIVLGEEYHHEYIGHGPDYEDASVGIRIIYPDSSQVIQLFSTHVEFPNGNWNLYFDALTIGDSDGDDSTEIITSHRETYYHSGYPEIVRWLRLNCINPLTGRVKWSETDSGSTDQITGLAICDLSNKSTKAVCVVYNSGQIKFKNGFNGTNLIISPSLPIIDHFALGNVDNDNVTEICIASEESLYIFEAPFITTDVPWTNNPMLPKNFSLFQNYPNPFNSNTNIRFTISERSSVTLSIYNILGKRVKNFERFCTPGTHIIIWDGKNSSGEDVASGVYLYKLTVSNRQEIKKMVLLR